MYFSPTNSLVKQRVPISVLDDLDAYDGGTVTILVSINPASSVVFRAMPSAVTLSMIDDDSLSITLNSTNTIGVGTTTLVDIATNTIILEGTSDSFFVQLKAQPLTNMTIEVTFKNTANVSMTLKDINDNVINAVLFSSDNWNKAQTVYIVALDDDDVLNDQITITLNISSDSSAVYFYGLSPATEVFSLWIEDDDEPAILIAEVSATITEATTANFIMAEGLILGEGSTRNLLVRLQGQPVSDITVEFGVTSSYAAIGTPYRGVSMSFTRNNITINQLSFGTHNWNDYQTILLTVIDDTDAYDGTMTINLEVSDATTLAFAKVYASATMFVIDDDVASITLSSTNTVGIDATTLVGVEIDIIILEGTSDSFFVTLNAKPYKNVTLELGFEHATYASMTFKDINNNVINALLFSSDNWNKSQTVYIVALDDVDTISGPITMTINIANASSLVYGDGLSLATETFSLWIDDDEISLILLSKELPDTSSESVSLSYVVLEGVSQLLYIRLNSEIPEVVRVDVVVIDDRQDFPSAVTTIYLSPTDSLVKQAIPISVLDDLDAYDGGTVTILVSINPASSVVFRAMPSAVTVSMIDDDSLSITLSATNTIGVGTTTLVDIATNTIILEGTSGSFFVQLTAQPINNMTIEMNFENSAYASMTLKDINNNVINAVLFNSDNWNKAQTVYIVALDDGDVINGQITITLNISSDSSAVYFYGLSPATEVFSLWIEDNDPPLILLSKELPDTSPESVSLSYVILEGVSQLLYIRLNSAVPELVRIDVEVIDDRQDNPPKIRMIYISPTDSLVKQRIPISILDDLDAYDGGTVTILVSVNPASSLVFKAMPSAVTLVMRDDDSLSITLNSTNTIGVGTTTLVDIATNTIILEGEFR